MWIESKKVGRDNKDWNAELRNIKGSLTDEEARVSLCQFLRHNLKFTTFILTGIRLAPYQSLLVKAWFKKNFCLNVLGRGCGKTFSAGIFALLYAIFFPNEHILVVSATFRSSRRILEAIDKLARGRGGALLMQAFGTQMKKGNDMYTISFKNGSSISAVPLGNSDKLRGLRCSVLILDELLLIPKIVVETILMPFLSASANIPEKMRIRSIEDRLIKKGVMKEEDRRKFESTAKLIGLSSASFTFDYLYEMYQSYLDKINKGECDGRYFVSQLSYEVVPKDLLDPSIIDEMVNGSMSKAVVDREMRAMFTSGSEGYFSAVKMKACSIPDGEKPSVELVGKPEDQYVLAIDPSFSSAEHSDNFAMCLMKIVEKKDGRKIGMVVHQYGVAGGDLKSHICYLHYILTCFNVVYIAIDSSGGDSNEFISSANNSKVFKDSKIEILDIEADFNKDDYVNLPTQIKRSYNKGAGRIVQKQGFNAVFQRAANEHLQACLDFKQILFASKAASLTDAGSLVEGVEHLLTPLKNHESFNNPEENSPLTFLEEQDRLLDQVKKECALIEPRLSALGTMTFDLPTSLKRSRSPNRPRKDNYSALFLCNFALKLYLESQSVEVEEIPETFTPFAV
jgi:hypothetical protein